MKHKSQIFWFLKCSCLATTLMSCVIYSTVDVTFVKQITKKKYLAEQMVWTIEDATHVVRVIQDKHIQNDSIFGKLVSTEAPDHPGRKKTYFKSKGQQSLNYLHLHLDEKLILSDSTILKIPLAAITSVTKHKNQHPLLITVVLVIILVPFFAILGYDM